MTTLTEFLSARLDEDEAAARAVPPPLMHRDTFSVRFDSWESDHSNQDRAFVDRFDPARVLAEVEAKRRILRREQENLATRPAAYPWYIVTLAAIYRDHPDYDPTWAPTEQERP